MQQLTPKEEAIQLVDKFGEIDNVGYYSNDGYSAWSSKVNLQIAKECAIICVNEVIEELIEWGEVWMKRRIEHYQQVLQEISKL